MLLFSIISHFYNVNKYMKNMIKCLHFKFDYIPYQSYCQVAAFFNIPFVNPFSGRVFGRLGFLEDVVRELRI